LWSPTGEPDDRFELPGENSKLYNPSSVTVDDGTRVAVSAIDEGNQDIWLIDLARNTNTRFTSEVLITSSNLHPGSQN
jgi:hypothetical protein